MNKQLLNDLAALREDIEAYYSQNGVFNQGLAMHQLATVSDRIAGIIKQHSNITTESIDYDPRQLCLF